MRKSQFITEQIVAVLEHAAGTAGLAARYRR